MQGGGKIKSCALNGTVADSFSSGRKGADVRRILDDIVVTPRVIALSKVGDLTGLINFQEPGAALVFIEYHDLPYEKRVARHKTLHSTLKSKVVAYFDVNHA